jgi:cytochrome c553
MSESKMPAFAHKLYAVGLIIIMLFVLIAWVFTAYSVSAKTVSNLPDHQAGMAPHACTACHETDARAPKIPHVALPTCGYCHR